MNEIVIRRADNLFKAAIIGNTCTHLVPTELRRTVGEREKWHRSSQGCANANDGVGDRRSKSKLVVTFVLS
jgi:hypothetical protein